MKKEFKLIKIVLYNIFNYRGRTVIDFNNANDGNIFLFDIKNGGGKTSLFLSIKWGFYGTDSGIEYVKDGILLKNRDFMNQDERAEGKFHVMIGFEYDGKYIEFRRECPDYQNDSTIFTVKIDGNMKRDTDAKEYASQIIPPDYGDFFMFNGEVLQEIANNQKDHRKTDGVLKLLGLKQFNDLLDLLKIIQKNMSMDFSKASGTDAKVTELQTELKRLTDKAERVSEKLEKDVAEKERIDSDIKILEDERRRYANVQSTIDAIDNAKKEKRLQENKRDRALESIRNQSGNAFTLFIRSDIKALKTKLEDRKSILARESRLAGMGKNEYLHIQNDIIDKHLHECPVCSSLLSDDSIERLNKILAESYDRGEWFNRNQKESRDLELRITILKEGLIDIPKNLDKDCIDLFNCTAVINELDVEIANMNKIASNSDIDAVKDISQKISKMYVESTNLDKEIFNERNIHISTVKKLNQILRELESSTTLSNRQTILMNRVRFVESLILNLESLINSASRNKRGAILEKANFVFMNITNKSDVYRGLEYDDAKSFAMHIVRKADGETVLNPSSGEKHVLAISFLVSLSLNTERLNPMMMDTPLSRLDSVHKMNIGRTLSKLGNQVLFLAQPGELDDETRKSLKPSLAKMFIAEPTEDNTAYIVEVKQ